MFPFLKNNDPIRKLQLQIAGFQSNTYLSIVQDLLEIPTFKLPEIYFNKDKVRSLSIPDNLRLGNRLERFFTLIIEESDRYNLVAENIQVIKNKITLGELDFIVYDTIKKSYIHIELAAKIYLYDEDITDELARWIGPNRKDSLLQKVKKLQTKQFPLLYDESTMSLIKAIGVNPVLIRQNICFKSRLFLPYRLQNTLPKYIESDNIKGYYLGLDHFLSLLKFRQFQYFIPFKQDWIVGPQYGEIWFDFDKILPKIELALLKRQSPLLWVKKPNNEYDTIFIVWW